LPSLGLELFAFEFEVEVEVEVDEGGCKEAADAVCSDSRLASTVTMGAGEGAKASPELATDPGSDTGREDRGDVDDCGGGGANGL
jgi:hypothetical protein